MKNQKKTKKIVKSCNLPYRFKVKLNIHRTVRTHSTTSKNNYYLESAGCANF